MQTFTPVEVGIIEKIARLQIADLMELQKHPDVIHKRVMETRAKGMDDVTMSDYYEDLLESWNLWENILDKPQDFLKQPYPHNFHHVKWVMENCYKPTSQEKPSYKGLIGKLVLCATLTLN
jgi:hypothetical protein